MKQWADQHEGVEQLRRALEESRLAGSWSPTYRFDDGVVGDEDIQIERDRITVSGRVVELDADLPSNWRL